MEAILPTAAGSFKVPWPDASEVRRLTPVLASVCAMTLAACCLRHAVQGGRVKAVALVVERNAVPWAAVQ